MTFSLDTLTLAGHRAGNGQQPNGRLGAARFATEAALVVGFVLLVLWLLALLSYSPQDAAWSTSGAGTPIQNRGGRVGAWLADASFFLLGFSVWWCVAAGVKAWLAGLAAWLRSHDLMPAGPVETVEAARWFGPRVRFWFGLILLVVASSALEWTRLYSLEARLPGHGGGVLGYFIGPLSLRWLGFTGSGLVAIAAVVAGTSLAFGFSWAQVSERLGAWLFSRIETRREQRELAQDIALGQQAATERAEVLVEERQDKAVNRPKPVTIEPVPLEVPKSERVAKERQKPLFQELVDTKLPQVDLLDAAMLRQETVSPETLEMTSRMIEKKLRDFGVSVTVVLAQPGPVITRYEIEPATGVKGSQIVGLAKDLARWWA